MIRFFLLSSGCGRECLNNEVEVLLVEDNRADVILLREALEQAGISYHMHVAKDGIVAMDFLRRRGEFARSPQPDLIILDMNMPRRDGREVLSEIMPDPDLRRIPIIILTSSSVDQDVVKIYGLREGSYMIKPVSFIKYVEVAKAIEAFRRQAAERRNAN